MNNARATQWFASAPKGLESLLAQELETLGATRVSETVAGCYFDAPVAVAYRTCLWSRLASRIFLPLGVCEANSADALYAGVKGMDWHSVVPDGSSLAIDFTGQNRALRNTRFGAQRCKDAIVDNLLAAGRRRPDVDLKSPDLRINVRLVRDEARIAVDFSGHSLHRRGYRLGAGGAPLKENLAAAMLLRADWPGIAAAGGALIDPMCGSGTLLIEGAMMAADIAPGLLSERFGFEGWAGHNAAQWQAIRRDAETRAERGRARQLPEIRGYDADGRVIHRAQENIARIGLEKNVRVTSKSLAELRRPTHKPLEHGLVICNPPYGERLGEKQSLRYLYGELGDALRREFSGWQAALLTSDDALGKATGLHSPRRYTLFNGALRSSLLLFDLGQQRPARPCSDARAQTSDESSPAPAMPVALSEGAQMFANRLRKNRKRLSRWTKREDIHCYRLYDADMPEYAVAVDVYEDWLHVAEYKAPANVDADAAQRRLEEVAAAVPGALEVPPERVSYKQRSRQRGKSQYEKSGHRGELMSVREGQARLLVNLHDYLDTGLFLDHRPLRRRLALEARGKDFLNLFCYTGAATVHAAIGGAHTTTSVDLSNTYLGWLRKNLAHNGQGESRHDVVRADCREWLAQTDRRFDLVMLDPPSFSNSTRMDSSFDVQRDHVALVRAAMAVLKTDGILYFSNNRRGFSLAEELEQAFICDDITRETLDPDFERNARIHCCFRLRHRSNGS